MLEHTRSTLLSRVLLAALLSLGAWACDDDTARPGGDDALTEAEAVALVDGLAAVGRLTNTDAASAGEPTVQCPLGGVVDFSGSFTTDSTANTVILRSEIVMTPRDCGFTARGTTITATGAPDVRQTGAVTVTGFYERVEVDYDIMGAVDWETGSPARQGRCTLDLDLVGEVELPTVESSDTTLVLRGRLSGTACQVAVDLSLDSIGTG